MVPIEIFSFLLALLPLWKQTDTIQTTLRHRTDTTDTPSPSPDRQYWKALGDKAAAEQRNINWPLPICLILSPLGSVWVLSGWCLCVVKGVMVPKQVKKVQLVLYHAASAFKSYIPLSLLQATLASSKGRNGISPPKKNPSDSRATSWAKSCWLPYSKVDN